MKKFILVTCLALAGSYSVSKAQQGYDPNYKHQAGKTADHSIDYVTIQEQSGTGHDANYKHQAGRRQQSRKNALTLPTGGTRKDGNYKHQFPSR
ncbi:MAG: hypothetical protein ACJ75J_07960 [Cytophagaceae bacterium]